MCGGGGGVGVEGWMGASLPMPTFVRFKRFGHSKNRTDHHETSHMSLVQSVYMLGGKMLFGIIFMGWGWGEGGIVDCID